MDLRKHVEVCFTPGEYAYYKDEYEIVVVIDVLRATSAICAAFANGINSIIPVPTVEEAWEYKKKGYSFTTLTAEGWSDPTPMVIKKYDKMAKGRYVHFCMAPSGNVIILSFSEVRRSETTELYVCKRITDKKWTKPVKMTGTVEGDYAPFIAGDNKTMYFTSDGRGGFG
eukprot:gene37684-61032_t